MSVICLNSGIQSRVVLQILPEVSCGTIRSNQVIQPNQNAVSFCLGRSSCISGCPLPLNNIWQCCTGCHQVEGCCNFITLCCSRSNELNLDSGQLLPSLRPLCHLYGVGSIRMVHNVAGCAQPVCKGDSLAISVRILYIVTSGCCQRAHLALLVCAQCRQQTVVFCCRSRSISRSRCFCGSCRTAGSSTCCGSSAIATSAQEHCCCKSCRGSN